jgi:hypothetical protein
LSGFDRIRFRGTFRQLAHLDGMSSILAYLHVLLKDFRTFAEETTARFRAGIETVSERADRPVQYLPSPQTNKEALVERARRENGVGAGGVIAVLSTVEVCRSYEIRRNRQTKFIELQPATRKCLHYYVYFRDSMFGLVHVRMQSWFPFNVHMVVNGREWLARQMDAARLAYQRADNCFPWIEDFARAQKLADRQLKTDWPKHLERLLHAANPAMRSLLPTARLEPYWSAEQSEWASDVAFASAKDLAALYPRLVQHAMTSFQSRDVLRFLGRRSFLRGQIHPAFKGEVVSDVAARPEGVRVKHRVNGNAVKMYDKQGSVLRVETTINDARDLQVFRAKEGDPKGKPQYRPLRKGVADLRRRAQLCQSANRRYFDALAAADSSTPLKEFTDALSRPANLNGRRRRALNPLGPDASLLAVVSRAEFLVKGFRNADVRTALLGPDPQDDPRERRRRSARVSRLLTLLRAHGGVALRSCLGEGQTATGNRVGHSPAAAGSPLCRRIASAQLRRPCTTNRSAPWRVSTRIPLGKIPSVARGSTSTIWSSGIESSSFCRLNPCDWKSSRRSVRYSQPPLPSQRRK